MAAAAGGGTKASANMWAVLADDDPGDNEAAKRLERDTKGREATEYKHQQTMATAASRAARRQRCRAAPPTSGRSEEEARTKAEQEAEEEAAAGSGGQWRC
ncbi:unnamed protein product [Miscanthus lutarioriparius]|uniref:Uncharacterized protein n=1 Tax=Miscanthus lutarioriparius TaxID=422564 RepID=A0A811S0X7_9POAL|nr:unnamed protein product [Miscanthus lutarioriparius]